jgi:hypothetical protein
MLSSYEYFITMNVKYCQNDRFFFNLNKFIDPFLVEIESIQKKPYSLRKSNVTRNIEAQNS